jgi:hypothetical protein
VPYTTLELIAGSLKNLFAIMSNFHPALVSLLELLRPLPQVLVRGRDEVVPGQHGERTRCRIHWWRFGREHAGYTRRGDSGGVQHRSSAYPPGRREARGVRPHAYLSPL